MKNIAAIIAVLIVLGAGAFALTRNSSDNQTNQPTNKSNNSKTTNTNSQTSSTTEDQNNAATITYSDSGFSPSSLTVKAGTTVTIKNTSSGGLQFDSDPHPEHTDNTELNVGFVASGKSTTFTVHRTGSFGYHNHLSPDDRGQLIVE